jgi:hypothetical protein
LAGGREEKFKVTLRACSRSSEQKRQEGEEDELQAGVEFALAVFPQTPAFLDPGQRTLNYPALGHNGEGV